MYVVLQGIESLTCIRVYITYIIPFGGRQPWMSEAPELENKEKTGPPKWSIYFDFVLKKIVFQTHLRVRTPMTDPVEKW